MAAAARGDQVRWETCPGMARASFATGVMPIRTLRVFYGEPRESNRDSVSEEFGPRSRLGRPGRMTTSGARTPAE